MSVINNTKKDIIITLVIVTIMCVFLVILLDIYFFNSTNVKFDLYWNLSKTEEHSSWDRPGIGAIKVENTFQDLMQIADIYDEDTLIEEVEDIDQNDGTSEDYEVNSNVSFEYVEEILDKNNKCRIKIPKINVDAPIRSGITQDVLATAVGHFPDTTSWNGNVALAGHNRGYRCNFFQNIKNLKVGDKIIYSTDKGERTYKIIVNKIIKQTDWSYLQGTNDNRLTLITCVENMREYRRCVQAVEV